MKRVQSSGFRRTIAVCCVLAVLLSMLAGCGGKKKDNKPIPASTNEERLTYLGNLGWQVDPEPLETLALQLPREPGSDCSDYLKLQEDQSMPFARYAGKTASRYTYKVNNYPGYEGPVQINLWVCEGGLIGGDLIAPGENGFKAGLAFPK